MTEQCSERLHIYEPFDILGVWKRQIIRYVVVKSLQIFESLQIFLRSYIRNVWVYRCPCDSNLMLKLLYFHTYVHHSYNCDAPLEVFISMNAKNGDVYSAKCSCVYIRVRFMLMFLSAYILFLSNLAKSSMQSCCSSGILH